MRHRTFAWTLPVGVVLALATWHVETVRPGTGIDSSWQTGLAFAAQHGLDFGRDVVFTYGPLGFLSVPLVVSAPLAVAAFVFAALVQVVLAVVVYRAATRLYGPVAGAVVAFLALGLTLLVSDGLAYLALFAAVWALDSDDLPLSRWLVPLGAFVAAFELLVKLNGGILCLVLFGLAAWRLAPWGWRSELLLASSFAVSLVVLWLVTGNALGALPDWLRESRHVVGGYTDAMALDPAGRTPETVVAVLLAVGGAVALFLRSRDLSRARATALALVVAAYVYAYAKEGFVRHDAHALDFFGALAVGALAFAWRWTVAVLVVGAAVGALLTPEVSISHLYRPDLSVRHAAVELRDVVTGDVSAARAKARARLGIPEHDLALLRGHTVDSVPYETSAVWAYGLRWRPEPLLQWYMAYDEHLDAMNAARVAADRVLRQRVVASDGKVPEFEAPATYLALLCRYREVAADGTWEVLARTNDRCGRPQRLTTVQARAGKPVAVPRAQANELVVAHLRIPRSFGARLLSTVLKPFTLPQITLGGNTYRLVAATASGPLVMRAPAAAGRSPFFGGATEIDSFAVSHVPAYTVEFDAIPIRPQRSAVEIAAQPPGALAGSSLTVRGRTYRVEPGAFQAWVDIARPVDGLAALAGWAVDPATRRPAPLVAVFAGNRLVGVARPSEARGDVASALHSATAEQSGYSLFVRLPAHVRLRVFALGAGRATEVNYPPAYPFGR